MGSYGNTVLNNTIINCGGALFFWIGAAYNLIYGNNFINNSFYQVKIDVTSNPSMGRWDNGIIGNYWSDYTGDDADDDGIGDTPYVIDEYNKDNYPLMKPCEMSPTPKPQIESTTIVIGFTVVAVAISVGLLVYFKKRKH